MALLLTLWALAVASADDKYPVAVGAETTLQGILDSVWKVPVVQWLITLIMSVLNTVYTIFINVVLTFPALSLATEGD
jgi:hypothetical protein